MQKSKLTPSQKVTQTSGNKSYSVFIPQPARLFFVILEKKLTMNSQNLHIEKAQSIDSIAEQWVNLVFAHLDYNRRNKEAINNYKEENKNGKTKI